jgi:hypothetical protein
MGQADPASWTRLSKMKNELIQQSWIRLSKMKNELIQQSWIRLYGRT